MCDIPPLIPHIMRFVSQFKEGWGGGWGMRPMTLQIFNKMEALMEGYQTEFDFE